MAEFPLLSHKEELAAARQIERTRTRFHHGMLDTDYLLRAAMHLLEKVRDGRLRLDCAAEISVSDARGKNISVPSWGRISTRCDASWNEIRPISASPSPEPVRPTSAARLGASSSAAGPGPSAWLRNCDCGSRGFSLGWTCSGGSLGGWTCFGRRSAGWVAATRPRNGWRKSVRNCVTSCGLPWKVPRRFAAASPAPHNSRRRMRRQNGLCRPATCDSWSPLPGDTRIAG